MIPAATARPWSVAFCTDSRRHRPAHLGAGVVRAVADRPDRVIGRPQRLVDDDPVADRQPGPLGQLDVRRDPDGDDHDVGLQLGAVPELDAGHRPVADELRDRRLVQDRRAVLGVQRGEVRGDRRGHGAGHRAVERLHDGDLRAALARGRRELEADEAAADDDEPGRVGQPLAQHLRVADGAQHEDPVEVRAGHGQRPRPRPGRQHEVVVVQDASRRELQRAVLAVDALGAVVGDQPDRLGQEERLGAQVHLARRRRPP